MSIHCVIFAVIMAIAIATYGGNAAHLTSPDGKYTVSIADGSFRITRGSGETLFTSTGQGLSAIQTDLDFYPETVLWSSDGHFVAIAAGTPFLRETFVFAHQGDSYAPVRLPKLARGYDNFYITPQHWTKPDTLILKITGPHAGKAEGSSYEGTAIVRITGEPAHCRKISEDIREVQARKTPSQTMQRTASRAAIYALSVCYPSIGFESRFTGLAVADLESR